MACRAAASASAALGVPITMHCIGDDDVGDDHRALALSGALLVRPDDFVGWRTDELPADPRAAYTKRFRGSCAAEQT